MPIPPVNPNTALAAMRTMDDLPEATAWITIVNTSQGPSSQVNWTQMRGVNHHPLFTAGQMRDHAATVLRARSIASPTPAASKDAEEVALSEFVEALRPPALKTLVAQLRYMGKQYGAGQEARGGGRQKHYLEQAADELDALFAAKVSRGQEIADLRNVVQAACAGGLPAMAEAWKRYFPDHPISISAIDAARSTLSQEVK